MLGGTYLSRGSLDGGNVLNEYLEVGGRNSLQVVDVLEQPHLARLVKLELESVFVFNCSLSLFLLFAPQHQII